MRSEREHFDWCVERANEYFDRGDAVQGVTSFLADVRTDDRVSARVPNEVALLGLMEAATGGVDAARRFIAGFPRPEAEVSDGK